jgi:hypothetical protein
MLVFTDTRFSAYRPAFVEAFPLDLNAHRAAQKAMFGAARAAGLPTTEAHKAAMIGAINQLLGLRLESRKQLTVQEMECITVAIESGAFLENWRIIPGFSARVRITVTVDLSPAAANYMASDYAGYDEAFPA